MKLPRRFIPIRLQHHSSEQGSLAALAIVLIAVVGLFALAIQLIGSYDDDDRIATSSALISTKKLVNESSLLAVDEALNEPDLAVGWQTTLQNVACLVARASGKGTTTGSDALRVTLGAYSVDSSGTATPWDANSCHTCGGASTACAALALDIEAASAAQRGGNVKVPHPFIGIAVEKGGRTSKGGTRVRSTVAAAVPPVPGPIPVPGPPLPTPTATSTPTATPTVPPAPAPEPGAGHPVPDVISVPEHTTGVPDHISGVPDHISGVPDHVGGEFEHSHGHSDLGSSHGIEGELGSHESGRGEGSHDIGSHFGE